MKIMTIDELKTYFNKISIFINPQKVEYWNSITKCSIREKPINLSNYYLDFSSKIDYPGNFSENGIPLFSYKGQPPVEQPIVIAQYGLGLSSVIFNEGSKKNEMIEKFLNIADWFCDNKELFTEGYCWRIKHLYPHYNLTEPWVSAMAQGEAISVLTRAALLSNKRKYSDIAVGALTPFEFDVNKGGVRNYFNSLLVFEEFTTPIRTMAVLNGYFFALFGLYDLYLLNKNEKSYHLFSEGVYSLKQLLPYYDLKGWSRYYLFDYPKKYYSSLTYHILVIEQLKVMYLITGSTEFKFYYEKWESASKSIYLKSKALISKILFANSFSK